MSQFAINSAASLKRAQQRLAEAWEKHKYLRVTVACGFDRSVEQNKLAFRWYNQIAEHSGESPEDVHSFCKLQFGCPVLRLEDESFARAAENMIDPLPYEQQLEAMRFLPVTRLLTVKGMTDYLTQIQLDYGRQGLCLTGLEKQH